MRMEAIRFSVLGGDEGEIDGIPDRCPSLAVAGDVCARGKGLGWGSPLMGRFWWEQEEVSEEGIRRLVDQAVGKRGGAPARVRLPFAPPITDTERLSRHRMKCWWPGAMVASPMPMPGPQPFRSARRNIVPSIPNPPAMVDFILARARHHPDENKKRSTVVSAVGSIGVRLLRFTRDTKAVGLPAQKKKTRWGWETSFTHHMGVAAHVATSY